MSNRLRHHCRRDVVSSMCPIKVSETSTPEFMTEMLILKEINVINLHVPRNPQGRYIHTDPPTPMVFRRHFHGNPTLLDSRTTPENVLPTFSS